MAPTAMERLQGYVLPGALMFTSIAFYLQTAITSPGLLFTDFQSFRDRAFAKLWLFIGPKISQEVPPGLDPILASLKGVILDVGPGAGDLLFHFTHPENIKRVYAAEPGVTLHAKLMASAKKAGLSEKYKVLACGAEPESLIPALANEGLLGKAGSKTDEGIFDEIVCLRVLCGVPRQEETIKGLYGLLKRGGRMVVFEHVVNDSQRPGGSKAGRFFQYLYTGLGWPFWLGGCCLDRDTEAMLRKAALGDGGWAEVRLEKSDEWAALPQMVGYLAKKG